MNGIHPYRALHAKPVTLAALQITDRTADAVDRAINEAGWITQGGPRHRKEVVRLGVGRWQWRVYDDAVSPHEILAEGRSLGSKGRAQKRAHRAYERLLRADS